MNLGFKRKCFKSDATAESIKKALYSEIENAINNNSNSISIWPNLKNELIVHVNSSHYSFSPYLGPLLKVRIVITSLYNDKYDSKILLEPIFGWTFKIHFYFGILFSLTSLIIILFNLTSLSFKAISTGLFLLFFGLLYSFFVSSITKKQFNRIINLILGFIRKDKHSLSYELELDPNC